MDNFEITQRVNFIKEKLRVNAATFVLDDSAALIEEWMNLQRCCNHMRHDGKCFFDIQEYCACPICDLSRKNFH